MATNRISFELADEYFFYEPFLGVLFWKKSSPGSKMKPGQRAGSNTYNHVMLLRRPYKITHIMWLLVTGEWPLIDVDHINRNPTDNRWENLRLANRSQNIANQTKRLKSTSRYLGVSWDKVNKKWKAQIKAQSLKSRNLGRFDNEEAAARCYDKTAKEMHGEFANLNFPEPQS